MEISIKQHWHWLAYNSLSRFSSEQSGMLYISRKQHGCHCRNRATNTSGHKRQLAFLTGNSLGSGIFHVVRYSLGYVIPSHLQNRTLGHPWNGVCHFQWCLQQLKASINRLCLLLQGSLLQELGLQTNLDDRNRSNFFLVSLQQSYSHEEGNHMSFQG